MQRAGLSLVLAVLVVLAGCSDAGSRAPTVTPAAVPDDEPTTPIHQPKRVTIETANDVDAVVAAHRAALTDRSFSARLTLRTETVEDDGNRTRLFERRTLVAAPDYRLDHRSVQWSVPEGDGYVESADRFVDGSTRLSRAVEDGTVSYHERGEWPELTDHSVETVRELFAAGNVSVERVRNANGTRFVVETATPPAGWNTSAFHARLVVDDSGVVERLNASYVRVVSGSVTAIETTMTFSGVGTTTVDRPPWYDAALRATENATVPPDSPRETRELPEQ